MWLLWYFWEKVCYVYSAITTWCSDAVLAEFILNKYRKSAVGHCFPPKSRGQPNSVQLHRHSQQFNCGRGISAKALVPLETKTRHLEGSRTIQLLLCSPEGKIFDFFICHWTTSCTVLKYLALPEVLQGNPGKLRYGSSNSFAQLKLWALSVGCRYLL